MPTQRGRSCGWELYPRGTEQNLGSIDVFGTCIVKQYLLSNIPHRLSKCTGLCVLSVIKRRCIQRLVRLQWVLCRLQFSMCDRHTMRNTDWLTTDQTILRRARTIIMVTDTRWPGWHNERYGQRSMMIHDMWQSAQCHLVTLNVRRSAWAAV